MLVLRNAFEMLLQAWSGFFDKKWVTAQEIIDLANDEASMRAQYERLCATDCENERQKLYRWFALRGALDHLTATKISGGDLDNILDEVKNKVVFNFLIERDGSCAQPLKWRVLLQEQVGMSVEEYNNFRAKFREKIEETRLKIDPTTAEVYKSWGNPFDPYEIENFPAESRTSEKLYWARSPGSNVFVFFGDLPSETRTTLWNLLETGRKSIKFYREYVEPAKLGTSQTAATPSREQQI